MQPQARFSCGSTELSIRPVIAADDAGSLNQDFGACGLCLVFSGLWCMWFLFGVLGTLVRVVYVGVLGTLVRVVYVWCSRDFGACGLCLVFSGL